ncbi:hypothetical protein [Donghicola sp.]|jgi:hypothetical protein|uniref:hypothetical protein n=1 Tax=Donghicola sp. TaxID=1929294 RepID=UPI0025F3C67A|nr:hypothetical protein [Donghicola sp.]MCT4576875.1 hypothetical protein [Donghicola sp.]
METIEQLLLMCGIGLFVGIGAGFGWQFAMSIDTVIGQAVRAIGKRSKGAGQKDRVRVGGYSAPNEPCGPPPYSGGRGEKK